MKLFLNIDNRIRLSWVKSHGVGMLTAEACTAVIEDCNKTIFNGSWLYRNELILIASQMIRLNHSYTAGALAREFIRQLGGTEYEPRLKPLLRLVDELMPIPDKVEPPT